MNNKIVFSALLLCLSSHALANGAESTTPNPLCNLTPHILLCARDENIDVSIKEQVAQIDKKYHELKLGETTHEEDISFLASEVDEVKDTVWNIFFALIGLLSLFGALGVVFTVGRNRTTERENSLADATLKFQKDELDRQHKNLSDSIDNAIKRITIRTEAEFDVLKHHIGLQHMLASGNVDQNEVYTAIRLMSREPRAHYLTTYSKLLKLNLDPEVQKAVEKASEQIKSELKTATQPEK